MPTPSPMQVETPLEVCSRLRISRSTLYELMAQGLPSRKIGRSRRFITSEVDAWFTDRNVA